MCFFCLTFHLAQVQAPVYPEYCIILHCNFILHYIFTNRCLYKRLTKETATVGEFGGYCLFNLHMDVQNVSQIVLQSEKDWSKHSHKKRHRRLNAYHSSHTHTRRHSRSISSFWLHLYAQFTVSMLFPLPLKVSSTPERKSDGMAGFWSGTCWKLTHLGTLPGTSQLDNGDVILTFPLTDSLRWI